MLLQDASGIISFQEFGFTLHVGVLLTAHFDSLNHHLLTMLLQDASRIISFQEFDDIARKYVLPPSIFFPEEMFSSTSTLNVLNADG
jgi:hypothetical protein